MSSEYASGVGFSPGDKVKGYTITEVMEKGAYTFPAKAKDPTGRAVFIKKYKRPGGSSLWYPEFVDYQKKLKERIGSHAVAKTFCYEFIEFFEMKKSSASGIPLRAFYQVFEWIEGGMSLREALKHMATDPNAFEPRQKVIFARVLMAALNSLHSAGIVHADLKPENLYLQTDPTARAKFRLRVIDLDYSILTSICPPWEGTDGYVGTPQYMSPEHLKKGVRPSPASDVFTAGLILGELLAGKHPAADFPEEYEDRALGGRLATISISTPIDGVGDTRLLEQVLNKMLLPDPALRPNAEQVLMALNGRFSDTGGAGSAPVRHPPPVGTATSPVTVPVTGPHDTASMGDSTRLKITGPGGLQLSIGISGTFGRRNFRGWGEDYEKFLSTDQFRLQREADGVWWLSHCEGATNPTSLNGAIVTVRTAICGPVVLTVGRSGKCPLQIGPG